MVTRSKVSEKRTVAQDLCVLYHEAVRSVVARETKASATRIMPTRTLDEVDASARKAFLSAATICIELGADARDFIAAQFALWREASAFHKRLLMPSPQHMATLAARVRYLQHQAREQIRVSRVITRDDDGGDSTKKWFVEERRLKGLARMQRRDPLEVLTEQPEQFSREFLKYKDVWNVVKDVWEEREHS
jgi:hypothetical protein